MLKTYPDSKYQRKTKRDKKTNEKVADIFFLNKEN